ncbi:MAG: hypothetical protein ACRDDL_08465, partial [Sarcina sp.]
MKKKLLLTILGLSFIAIIPHHKTYKNNSNQILLVNKGTEQSTNSQIKNNSDKKLYYWNGSVVETRVNIIDQYGKILNCEYVEGPQGTPWSLSTYVPIPQYYELVGISVNGVEIPKNEISTYEIPGYLGTQNTTIDYIVKRVYFPVKISFMDGNQNIISSINEEVKVGSDIEYPQIPKNYEISKIEDNQVVINSLPKVMPDGEQNINIYLNKQANKSNINIKFILDGKVINSKNIQAIVGTKVNISAPTLQNGQYIKEVLVNGKEVSNFDGELQVTGNENIEYIIGETEYRVAEKVILNGNVISSKEVKGTYGEKVQVQKPTLEKGQYIKEVLVNGQVVKNFNGEIEITGNESVEFVIGETEYGVAEKVTLNGNVISSKEVKGTYGEKVQVQEPTLEKGQYIKEVLVNGQVVKNFNGEIEITG